MAQVNPNSIAGQIAARNAAKKGAKMTSAEMVAENPNISAGARLQQAGVGGALRKGSYVLDNSAAGRKAGESDKPVIGTNGQSFNPNAVLKTNTNLTPGSTVQSSAANQTPASLASVAGAAGNSGSISPLSSVNTPSIPGVGSTSGTGLPPITSTTGTLTPGGSTNTPSSTNTNGAYAGINRPLTEADLQGDDLKLYNQLSDAQKVAFKQAGIDPSLKNEDIIKKQLQYLASVQENQKYLTDSNNISKKNAALQEQNANIVASQNIAKAQASVDSIRQAASYLGSKGQPGKSMVGLEAVGKQLDTAQRLFNQIVSGENNATEARSLGREQDVLNFEHQVQGLVTQLHTNVSQAILDAQQKLGNPDITDKVNDPEEMEKLISNVMNNLDGNIAGMTNVHLEQMTYLIDTTQKIQENLAAQKKSEATVNEQLSEAYGYYMNENGNPITGVDGKAIPFTGKPQFSGLDPVTGDFVIVTADGKIVRTPGVGTRKQATIVNVKVPDGYGGTIDQSMYQNADGSLSPIDFGNMGMGGDTSFSGGQGLDTDLSTMKSQYPGDAGVANNNPAGITFRYANGGTSDDFAANLTANGIPFTEGGNRAEGGTYYKFPTIGDGLKAYDLLHQQYLTLPVSQALEKWGTGSISGLTPEMKNMTLGDLKASNPDAYDQLRMQQIKKESPGVYKALQSIQNQQQGGIDTSRLSTTAREAYNTKSIPTSLTTKTKDQITKELANAGVFDQGQGNSTYYTASPTIKAEIPTTLSAYDEFQQAYKAYQNLKTNGTLDNFVGPIDGMLTMNGVSDNSKKDPDVIILKRVLGKTLSQYMNKISGATVSEQEVDRLRNQIPNLRMSAQELDSAMDAYNSSLNRGVDHMNTTYGFSDINSAKKAVYGDHDTPTSPSPLSPSIPTIKSVGTIRGQGNVR